MIQKIRKIFSIKNSAATLISIALIAGAYFFQEKSQAQNVIATPWGGVISKVEYCCNGLKITISGPKGINQKDYFLSYSDIANPTVTYSYYQVFYGAQQNSLGTAFPVATCSTISSECAGQESVAGGTITKIGTGIPAGI